ncbi:MAG: hypothetical protein IKF36_00505 [Bacilli bacterium]|nr:hypothetical protein [Bacilli bacterium]
MINIIEIFNEVIETYNKKLEELLHRKEEISKKIDASNNKRNELKKNANSIIKYSDEEIMNIVNNIKLDGELLEISDIEEVLSSEDIENMSNRKKILSLLLQIKYLAEIDPNIQYTESQLSALEKVVNEFISSVKVLNEELSKINIDEKEVSIKMNKLKSILDKLSNVESKELVEDYETIEEVISKSKLDESQKIDFIFAVLDYNVKAYNSDMMDIVSVRTRTSSSSKKTPTPIILNEEEVDAILQKYSYTRKGEEYRFSTSSLIINGDRKYLDLLLKNGNLRNIDEVLNVLVNKYKIGQYGFDFTKEKGIKILVSLLIRSNVETIEQMVGIFEKYGINKFELFNKPAMLIKTKEEQTLDDDGESVNGENLLVFGVANNVIRNIEFFERNGFIVEDILKKALTIFESSPKTIEYNYKLFDLYGLPFMFTEQKKTKCPSAFQSVHADELLDRMLEISPKAYRYLTVTCMTKLLASDSDHDAIYELYRQNKSMQDRIIYHEVLEPLLLGPSEKTTEEKNAIAGTIVPPIKRKESYDKIVSEKLEERKRNFIEKKLDYDKENIFFDYTLFNENRYVRGLEKNYSVSGYPQVYFINGVYISKYKFLKVFNALQEIVNEENVDEILLYSLTYKSIISEEDFNKVKEAVSGLTNVKKGVIK